MKSFKELVKSINPLSEEEPSPWKIAFDVFSEEDERYKGFFIVFEGSQKTAILEGAKILKGMYPNHRYEITLSRVKDLSERDYKREYQNYHSRPEQIQRRSARNSARRIVKKKVKTEDIEGKDVHHKDNNPLNNDEKNLSVVTQRYNRREPRLRERKLKKEQQEE